MVQGAGITEWPLIRGRSLPSISCPAGREWHVWQQHLFSPTRWGRQQHCGSLGGGRWEVQFCVCQNCLFLGHFGWAPLNVQSKTLKTQRGTPLRQNKTNPLCPRTALKCPPIGMATLSFISACKALVLRWGCRSLSHSRARKCSPSMDVRTRSFGATAQPGLGSGGAGVPGQKFYV